VLVQPELCLLGKPIDVLNVTAAEERLKEAAAPGGVVRALVR
jgi:hypothetical protein